MIKKIISFGLLACVCLCCVKAQVGNAFHDGPYVLYRNSNCIIYSIDSANDAPVLVDSFAISKKEQHAVQVRFPDNPGWDFSVPFRKTLSIEPCEYPQPEKIFAISDIEGEFKNFRSILIAGKVMNEKSQWTFGNGHLVICGDLFDRGKDVVPELWLIYKLEAEAKKAGGYVHTILGDHEIMNLSGDLRYVQKKYMQCATILGMNYMDFYSAGTELGRWLRTKNIIEKIGNNLCMHGGLSPEVNAQQISLGRVNEICRPYFDQSQKRKMLDSLGIRLYFDGRSKSQTSPFWYRGYFSKTAPAPETQVDSSLALYHCKRVIVGHTIVPDIVSLYNGKVIGLDVNEHEAAPEAVLIEHDVCYTVNGKGRKKKLH